MATVAWTQQSLDDLDAICLFIARDSPVAATLFAQRVFEASDRLEAFPLAGRVVPEAGREELRELIVGRYRLIYRVSGEQINIITLHHGARPLGDI